MDSVINENRLSELSTLLTALQSFSISYLQKMKLDDEHKAFLYQIVNNVRELEKLLESAKAGTDVDAQLHAYRQSAGTLIEGSRDKPDDLKPDENVLSLLTNFYLRTITNAPVKPKPAKKTVTSKIKKTIKLLEKSIIYIPPTKTRTVMKLETKMTKILTYLKKPDITAKTKEQYVKEQIPEIDQVIRKLESNTEIILTSIQAEEMRSMGALLQKLGEEYAKKERKETEKEGNYLAEIKTIRDQPELAKKINELGKHYLKAAKFREAETILQEGLAVIASIPKDDSNETSIRMLDVSTRDLLAQSLFRLNKYSAAKTYFQQAADLLKNIPAGKEHYTLLLGQVKMAEEQEAEAILKDDKDIQALKQMQTTLQQSGDLHLLHIVNKVLAALYEKLIDPEIAFSVKTVLVNEFMDRWNKFVEKRAETAIKEEWYTPEMEKIINGGLTQVLRAIREMFAAQAAVQQAASPAAMIEAKEKAKADAQIRAKAARAALLAKAEAARARADAERMRVETQEKEAAAAKQKAEADAIRAWAEAESRARSEAAATAAAKCREDDLVVLRKKIASLMKEAKEWMDKAQKNVGKHEYKIFLVEEENKLREALELLKSIKPQERIDADHAVLSKCIMRQGIALRNQGKFKEAEESMQQAINTYDELLKKQDYGNIALALLKIEGLADLGRLYYMQKKIHEAEMAFNLARREINYLLSHPKIDESFIHLFGDLAKQNKAHALLMAKLGAPHGAEEKSNNMIEILYHFAALKRKVHEEEMKFVHHILSLDKNLSDRSPRIVRLQDILSGIERPLFRKVIRLNQILAREAENEEPVLDIIDKNILKSYNDALINFAFVDVLKNAAEMFPDEMLPFVAEIKTIRSELRHGMDLKLVTLGLPLEQRIVYLEYEKHLAELESRAAVNVPVNTDAIEAITTLLEEYKQQLANPSAIVMEPDKKIKGKWSIGGVISGLKHRRKKPKTSPLGAAGNNK